MVDRNATSKPEEQYPLLKVESGAGDGSGHPETIASTITPSWIVRCSKQSWFTRWPEFFSACWMTLVLLGISFLVFYALGMSAYRRNPIIVIKCNNTSPASNVYYHHIIPKGTYIPFVLYSEYIADMATRYPLLQFNIYFLLNDCLRDSLRYPGHGRFINKIIPTNLIKLAYNSKIDENNERQMRDFVRNYENVNITIMPLSKFMAMTPLQYYWRKIPVNSLQFYARVFSVWQNGGIGIDLTKFNNLFNNHRYVDRKILTILQQHNDGINPTEYTNALNRVDCGEETEFFETFFTFVGQLLNGTRSFFNNSLYSSPTTTENYVTLNTTLIRYHRDKRELYEIIAQNTDNDKNSSSDINITEKRNITNPRISNSSETTLVTTNDESSHLKTNNTKSPVVDLNTHMLGTNPANLNVDTRYIEIANNTSVPHLLMFYDFSIFNDELGPSFIMPEMIFQPDFGVIPKRSEVIKSTNPLKNSHFLSLDSDGTFIAATSRLHAFLAHIICNAHQYMYPKIAIRDTYSMQCFSMFEKNHYCNNVFLL